ncbi:hypothetical protein RCK87_24960, partial [Salmonella enterica subsp. enterica serovar 1,4,[5],12:i:-]
VELERRETAGHGYQDLAILPTNRLMMSSAPGTSEPEANDRAGLSGKAMPLGTPVGVWAPHPRHDAHSVAPMRLFE